MATRSNIAMQQPDGSFKYIYCHWDGYPEHNGAILLEYYQDPKKVEELISLGDLSFLGHQIGTKHAFDTKTFPEECTFYGRDRGETGVECRSTKDVKVAFDNEFLYVFMNDNKWYWCGRRQETLKELTKEDCK